MPEARTMPPLERLLYLKRIPILAGLPASELLTIADAASERFFPKGSVVFHEGDRASSMHFVVEGALAHERQGRRVGLVGPGGGLGALPLLARAAMASRAVAESDTLTLEIDADAVAEVLEDRFQIVQYLLRELSRQALELLRRNRLDPNLFAPELPVSLQEDGGLDLVDRLLLLRRMPVFGRTSITALAELARTMANVRYEVGTQLWQEGEPSQGIVMISSGRVQASGSGEVAFQAGPGFPLGALEALAQTPRWYAARALTPVVALQLQPDVLVDLLEDNFEMAMDYLALVSSVTLRILAWKAEQEPGSEAALEGWSSPQVLAGAREAGLSSGRAGGSHEP
ncbi:MAG TPA: cyclic nucleotide-binding domain-containing protein [Vicinamibacteria bacterium]|jgi:CRP-like cAMP-binding protein